MTEKKPVLRDTMLGKIEVSRMQQLFIGGIPYTAEIKDVVNALRETADIADVVIPLNQQGVSKGVALVATRTKEGAQDILKKKSDILVFGKHVQIQYAGKDMYTGERFEDNLTVDRYIHHRVYRASDPYTRRNDEIRRTELLRLVNQEIEFRYRKKEELERKERMQYGYERRY